MLEHLLNSHDLCGKLSCNLVPFVPDAMKLLSTNRARSLVIFILTRIFSSKTLTNYLGISGILQRSVTSELMPFVKVEDSKLCLLQQDVELNIKNQIEDLSIKIDQQKDILKRKRDRLSDDLIEDRKFEIRTRKQRLEKLKSDTPFIKSKWFIESSNSEKKNKMTNRKEERKIFINHKAERAIYERLAENAKAHRRRHGEKGTSYIDEKSWRVQSRQMRIIANRT